MHDVLAVAVRRGRQNEHRLAVTCRELFPLLSYAVGSIGGGALIGGLLGLGSNLAEDEGRAATITTLVAAAAVTVFAALLQAEGRVRPLPQRSRQVPRQFRLWRSRARCAAVWGFMLGSSAFTYLHYAAAYVVAAGIIVIGSSGFGVAVGATYGVVRAFSLFWGRFEAGGDATQPTQVVRAAWLAERSLTVASAICSTAIVAVAVVGIAT